MMYAPLKKSLDQNAPWKKVLARYRRLIACMIDESLGYFTPHAAVNAILAHKNKTNWSCEWYMHIDSCQSPGRGWDEEYDSRIKQINHDIISEAFARRKYYRSASARQVVEANIGKHESVLASWF